MKLPTALVSFLVVRGVLQTDMECDMYVQLRQVIHRQRPGRIKN
jgi:hypothetical protein